VLRKSGIAKVFGTIKVEPSAARHNQASRQFCDGSTTDGTFCCTSNIPCNPVNEPAIGFQGGEVTVVGVPAAVLTKPPFVDALPVRGIAFAPDNGVGLPTVSGSLDIAERR